MSDRATDPVLSPALSGADGPADGPADVIAEAPPKASVLTVLRDQRKTIAVAVVLAVVTFWIAGQLDEWRLATAISVGVGLGLLNHLATEYWLLRVISNGDSPTKAMMVRSTLVRLLVLTVVAVSIAVVWWPDGIGLLLGLAVFRLIALVMTTLPLLKELKSQ